MGRSKTKNTKTLENVTVFGGLSADNWLSKAEENLDTFDHEAAKTCCQKALDLEPTCLKAVDMMANLHVDLGEIEEAITYFKQSILLSPDSGFSKYLSLGQLLDGKEALEYYLKGVEILKQDIENSKENCENESTNNDDSTKSLHRFLSNAFCSISELYMTDNCDEENAEEQCKNYIEKAITSDPTNPESYQLMSSFYLVIEDHDKARELMDKSLSLWFPLYQAVRNGQEELSDDVELCPLSYPCRISTVKNCLELTKFEEAEVILNGLVEEDDEVVDVWYLLGLMNDLRGDDYHGNAKFYFNKCKEIASKIGDSDEELINEIDDRLKKLVTVGNTDEEDVQENDDDDEYEDIESSEEEMEQ